MFERAMGPLIAWAQCIWERLSASLAIMQFEGHYSVGRLQQLNDYTRTLNHTRIILILVLTPLPSLLLSLLKETLPLAPPEIEVDRQWAFFIRAWIVTSLIDVLVLLQIGQGVPRLQLKVTSLVLVALVASGITMTFIFGICSISNTFPLPFGVLIAAPPNIGVITGCFIYMSKRRWGADPSIWSDVKRQLYMLHSLVALTFIYPIYIYGYVSLSGIAQGCFVLALPIIKLCGRHLISHAFSDQNATQPEAVVFNVDVLMAVYMSSSVQSASSWTAIAAIMMLDLMHFWQTMVSIRKILREVEMLLRKIPHGHAIAKENFLQVAIRLINLEATLRDRCRKNAIADLTIDKMVHTQRWAESKRKIKSMKPLKKEQTPLMLIANMKQNSVKRSLMTSRARVFPIRPPHLQNLAKRSTTDGIPSFLALEIIFTSKERELFIHTATRVLFITEYILLIEYAEFVLPITFSIYRVALFYMPNRDYHHYLTGLSSAQLWASVNSGFLYGLLEFISFSIVISVLNRKLRLSCLRQLAFVLNIQRGEVQTKLVAIFVYVTQLSLIHLGADFSFQFSWLRRAA